MKIKVVILKVMLMTCFLNFTYAQPDTVQWRKATGSASLVLKHDIDDPENAKSKEMLINAAIKDALRKVTTHEITGDVSTNTFIDEVNPFGSTDNYRELTSTNWRCQYKVKEAPRFSHDGNKWSCWIYLLAREMPIVQKEAEESKRKSSSDGRTSPTIINPPIQKTAQEEFFDDANTFENVDPEFQYLLEDDKYYCYGVPDGPTNYATCRLCGAEYKSQKFIFKVNGSVVKQTTIYTHITGCTTLYSRTGFHDNLNLHKTKSCDCSASDDESLVDY